MERVERRVDVRNKRLRGERGNKALRVRAQVWRDLRALPDADLRSQENVSTTASP